MKIYANKESELERVLEGMHNHLLTTDKRAKEIIKELYGIEPETLGYRWVFGWTAMFDFNIVDFEGEVPEGFVKSKNDLGSYKPNLRTKKGKELVKLWEKEIKGIDGKRLTKYGIPVMHEESRTYCHWLPFKDEKGFYISVGSSLLDRMPKIDNKQYTVEML